MRVFVNEETGQQNVYVEREALEKVKESLYGVQSSNDKELIETMAETFKTNDGYFICPHTATAIAAIDKIGNFDNYKGVIAMATASSTKFIEALESANLADEHKDAKQLVETLEAKPVCAHFLEREEEDENIPYQRWTETVKEYLTENIFSKVTKKTDETAETEKTEETEGTEETKD